VAGFLPTGRTVAGAQKSRLATNSFPTRLTSMTPRSPLLVSLVQVLSALFDGDPVWRDAYCRLRESYLFILTCGGNFSPERDEPDLPGKMSNWLSEYVLCSSGSFDCTT
jgi:hypothetical protein